MKGATSRSEALKVEPGVSFARPFLRGRTGSLQKISRPLELDLPEAWLQVLSCLSGTLHQLSSALFTVVF